MTRCLQLIERSRNILGANGQLCRRVMLGRALCESPRALSDTPHTNTAPSPKHNTNDTGRERQRAPNAPQPKTQKSCALRTANGGRTAPGLAGAARA